MQFEPWQGEYWMEKMMDKTLYLNEKKGLTVMRDGPSLWIREKDKAGTRVPVRLVDMVFIIGNIKMDAGTINLFTENNTPVTFMNKRGEAIGVVMPYNHMLPDHHEEQRKFLQRDENVETFMKWISSMVRETQIAVMKKINWETAQDFLSKGFRDHDYTEIINVHRLSKEAEWKTIYVVANNLIMEMIIREIMASNLDPHMGVVNRNCNFGFALDLYRIIEPEADLMAIQFFTSCRWHDFVLQTEKQCILTKEGWKNIVHRFENRKKLIAQRLDSILRGYFNLLRQIVV
jgi:CRISPR/Cas system-associated endonuclease Cas1